MLPGSMIWAWYNGSFGTETESDTLFDWRGMCRVAYGPMIEIIANDRLGRKGKSESPSSLHNPLRYFPSASTQAIKLTASHFHPHPPLPSVSLRRKHSPREMSPLGHGGRFEEAYRGADGYDREQDPVEKVVRHLHSHPSSPHIPRPLVLPRIRCRLCDNLYDTDSISFGVGIIGTRRTRIISR